MGLLAPIALVALPLVGAIIALYLLRLRRPTAPVGSLQLWDRLTRDREANTLWQRLQVSTLLVLQVLALLVLIFALARPWVPASESTGRNVVVVVDVSASMASTDADGQGQRTRLQAAQDKAMDLIENLPDGGTIAVIAAGQHASVVLPATDDKPRARAVVHALTPEALPGDMTEAFRLAGAMAASANNSVVWLLSDGAFPQASVAPLEAPVRFVGVGRGAANQGITALSVEHDQSGLQLFVQLANSAPVTVTRRVDFTIDDVPWNGRNITLPPEATRELLLNDLPLNARVIKAQLAGSDGLQADDTAWTVNRSSAPANVLLVTTGTKFLELALSLLPVVNLYKVSPADYTPDATINGQPVDLTVFEASVPTSTLKSLPQGNVLIFDPKESNELVKVSGVMTSPVPLLPRTAELNGAPSTKTDALLKYVDLSQVNIARAARMDVPDWSRVALTSQSGPLIVIGKEQGRNAAVVAFDLHDTDLPLQMAFPLLMRNLITALLPDPAGGLPVSVSALTSVGIDAVNPRADTVLIEDPAGKEWTYKVSPQQPRVAFGETQLPGVYYVTQYAAGIIQSQEAFTVDLFSRDETMNPPRADPPLPVSAGASQGANAPDSRAEDFQREIWPWVALAGVLLLLIEWLYAQRIAIRRLITEINTQRALRKSEHT